MKKQILTFFLVSLLLPLLIIPLTEASYICPAAQPTNNSATDNAMYGIFPAANAKVSAYGVAFTSNATCYLYTVHVWLKRIGVVPFNLQAALYEIQEGSVGTNAYPTDIALAVSDVIDANILGATYSFLNFTFTGTYQMQVNTDYFLSIECIDGVEGDASHCVVVAKQAWTTSMNTARQYSSAWQTATTDMCFIINADTDPPFTPTPSPSPPPVTATPTATPRAVAFSQYLFYIVWGIIIAAFLMLLVIISYAKIRSNQR